MDGNGVLTNCKQYHMIVPFSGEAKASQNVGANFQAAYQWQYPMEGY
jgi:hypothetical protein